MKAFALILGLIINNSVIAQVRIFGKLSNTKGQPIKGASVTIKDSYDGATSDSTGQYSFETTEKGQKILEITSLGYDSLQIPLIIGDQPIEQSAIIKFNTRDLEVVVLTAGSFEAGDKKKGTVLSTLDIVTTASANADVTSAIKTLPGTQQVGESEGLFVRGGTATESKIFIDGNLVNKFFYSSIPNQATRGKFNPFLFKGTIFSSGAYSALYGQALSSALILETVDLPEKTEASYGVSIVGLNGGYQRLAKNKKSSWGISLGYANLAPAFKVIKQRQDFFTYPEYYEGDANFRVKTKSGLIKYYGYFTLNKLGFRSEDIDTSRFKNAFNLKNNYFYHNLNWRENLGSGWKITSGLSFSTNKDDIANQLQEQDNSKATMNVPDAYLDKNFAVDNKSYYGQLRFVLEKKLKGMNMLRFGAEHFYSDEQYDYTGNSTHYKANIKENLTAGFAEMDWYLSHAFALKTGLRAEHTALLDKTNLAPRVTLAYKLNNTSQASMAYGIFYQNPETSQLFAPYNNPGFAKAAHYILQYLYTANSRILRAETYYKKYNNLYMTYPSLNNSGHGDAAGFEVFYRDKKTIKNFDYWVSYTYLDTKRKFLNYPKELVPDFASKHTFSLIAKKFVLPIKTGFNASYTYASPRNYYQVIGQPQPFIRNQGKAKAFGDLSFSLNYVPSVGKQNAKSFSVLVFSVNNILGRDNIFTYNYGTVNIDKISPVRPPAKRFVFIGWFVSIGVDRTENVINSNL